MKETTGNLWDYLGKADAVCVTTNGTIKQDGAAVMGKGIAKQAVDRYPGIDRTLAAALQQYKINRPFKLVKDPTGTWVVSYPTKSEGMLIQTRAQAEQYVVEHMRHRFKYPAQVPGWALKSDLELIKQSARLLMEMADKFRWNNVVIPAPGSGAGELMWAETREHLKTILDDRFTIITYRE